MPTSSGYSKSPKSLIVTSAASSSSCVHGSSSVGMRMPYFSSVDLRVIIATAASHRPTE